MTRELTLPNKAPTPGSEPNPTGGVRSATETEAHAEGRRPVRPVPLLHSLRLRLFVQFLVLLAVALSAAVWIVHTVLTTQMQDRIQAELGQEVEELRVFASGNDPETGRPFDGVRRLFAAYLQSDVLPYGETAVTFADGQPLLRSPGDVPYRLDRDSDLVSRWSRISDPEAGSVETPAGIVDYAAVRVSAPDGQGVYVIAIFRNLQLGEVDQVVRTTAYVGLVALVVAALLAWRAGRRIFAPIDAVTSTALRISELDLSQRIEVAGRDEIARLAQAFNDMLARLQRGFEAQRQFVNDAGHELRTPITIIGGHLEILEDNPDERAETVALVVDELDRMARIVGDLLVLAKSERPDFVHLAPFDVTLFLEEVHLKVSALAPRRWQLDVDFGGVVHADRQRLTQALVQLAHNAVQHTDEQDTITLGCCAETDDRVRLWVSDTGSGIAREDQERIFARFARGPGVRRSDGAGLGLAIVAAIAAAHGGRAEVSSTVGAGAVFSLLLPRAGVDRGAC